MYVSATRSVPVAANLTTLGIATNRLHGQRPSAGRAERRRQCAPKRTAPKPEPRLTRRARSLQSRTRHTVARLRQRFVVAPWLAAEES
jgi:hypothetical protein